MSLTDRYCYEEPGSQEQYSHEPTNDLSVARLLLNKPAWKKPDGALVKKKKTLIIYAPEAAQWAHFEFIIAGERLLALKQKGFEIYVYQHNKLNQLNFKSLQTPKQFFEQKPLSQKVLIQQAAKQLNLSHDELFVLNDEELRVLIDGDEEDYAAYTAADEINLSGSNLNISSLNALLQLRASSITSLNLSGCLNLYQGLIPKDLRLPHLKELILEHTTQKFSIFDKRDNRRMTRLKVESIERLIASSEQLTHLNLSHCSSINSDVLQLIKNPQHLEELYIAGCFLNLNEESCSDFFAQAINLKTLDLSESFISIEFFERILKNTKRLKKLIVRQAQLSVDFETGITEVLDLELLEELDLTGTGISGVSLSKITAKSKNLKKIICDTKLSEETLKQLNYDLLEEIDVYDSPQFINGLNKTQFLKKLRLWHLSTVPTTIYEVKNLDSLIELDLFRSIIGTNALVHLLQKTINLKTLDLVDCLIDSEENDKVLNLGALEKLNLNGASISTSLTTKLLKNARNVKLLRLGFWNYDDEEIDEELNLELLETLDFLPPSTISTSSAQKIIKNAKNLKQFSLMDCSRVSDNVFETLNPDSLEKLHLKCSLNKNFFQFLKNTRNLKKLYVTESNFLVENPGTLNLASLKILTIMQSRMSSSLLGKFLKQARSLKIINLSKCVIVYPEPSEPSEPLDLQLLEQLELSHSNITSALLGTLLKNVKNLKKMGLRFCNNLFDELPEPLNLESLIELDARYSNISSASLEKLVKHAKNLNKMNLSRCVNLSKEPPEPLNLESLEELDLSGSNISSASLGKLLKNCKNLNKIDLSHCINLTEELPESLNLQSLEELNLSYSNISSASLIKLLKNAKNLKKLNISNCQNLFEFDQGAEELILPQLKYIDVSYTFFDTKALPKIKVKSNLIIKGAELNKEVIAALTTNSFPVISTATQVKKTFLTQTSPAPQIKLDADTTPSEVNYFPQRLFYGIGSSPDPEIRDYRQKIFNQLTLNPNPCAPKDAFELNHQSDDLQLDASLAEACIEDTHSLYAAQLAATKSVETYYYSKQILKVGSQWHALSSLSAHEQMLYYHVHPACAMEIRYSRRDNLYYVRTPASQTITLDFIVKVPQQDPLKQQKKLASDIQKTIQECQNFGNNALKTLPGQTLTGVDYLKAMTIQKVGACRHRMAVLAAWMQQNHQDIPVRCVLNECHAFIEIQHNNEWIRCDLGGYPAQVFADDSFRPTPPKQEALQAIPKINQTPIASPRTTPEPVVKKIPELLYFPQAKTRAAPSSADAYLQELLNAKAKRQLIEVANASVLAALRFGIQAYCHNPSDVDASNPKSFRPCHYIDSPEDLELFCASTYLKLEGTQGVLNEEPYGRLQQWITANKGQKPLLLINYSLFKPADIARFHMLLEDNGPLPKEVQLIGLMNQDSPDVYDGVDFYSRFDQKPNHCPLPAEAFRPPYSFPAFKTTEEDAYVLEFFGGSRWEEQMYGSWVLQGECLELRQSVLHEAFATKKPIELRNAPWHDAHFVRFWHEAQLYGQVKTPYESIEIPQETFFIQNNGYDWTMLTQELTVHVEQAPIDAWVLNPSTLAYFFSRYECDTTLHTLSPKAGILETHTQKPLNVYLSAPLSTHHWARLLDLCRHHQISLHIHIAFGISVPKEFLHQEMLLHARPPVLNPWEPEALKTQDFAISSTDIDATLHNIEADLVVDVSELDSSDLLKRIHPLVNQKSLSFRFSEEKGALIEALAKGKKVVLKGYFSPALSDALNEFLYARQGEGASGQIILISTNPEIKFLPLFHHAVDAQEKQRLIATQNLPDQVLNYFAAHECYQKQTFASLKTMVRYHRMHPQHFDLMQTWAGMQQLPASQPWTFNNEDLLHAQERAEQVDKARLEAIESALAHAPFVFIAGKTAVGKTTFLQQTWKKKHPHLYIGEHSLHDWACDTRKGLKVLFLDEANLSPRQWSEFESLVTPQPGIMIGNQYHPLTSEHKVIFAGNPLSYGGERTLAALFARHGHSVIFQPLPPAYLYHNLIAPVFTAAHLDAGSLAVPILEIADFLTHCDLQHVLISARELTMMALLTVSYCSRYPKAQPLDAVRYYAYHLSHPLVPSEALSAFSERWKEPAPLPQDQEKSLKNFYISPTNHSALMRLNEVLELRALRQKRCDHSLDGGLGGVILEGEPGIGKSELVVQCMAAHHLKKASLRQENTQENSFYHLPVSMALAQKKELLLRAFHEGAVVVIDEINCAPLMEELLNDLLMGKTPAGEPANKPGFTLIGTQNPSHMAGRRRMTPALLRRLHTAVIAPYSPEEMMSILILSGLPQPKAYAMVNEYLKNVQSPSHSPLCFRDLIKRAKHETIALNLNWAVKSDLNAQTNPFESTVETRLREQLIVQLQNYIHRIKITQKSDFSYGFWFFKQSRAMNRQANYELAKVLLEELTHEKPLNETFADIEQQRMRLIQLHRLNEKDNHGINSDELLKILTTARNHIQKQQQEKEVSRFCFW